ncbi:MAG: alcohol dehydrogenase catalytic domain-containing protein [Bacillota bacterium]
MIPEMMKAVVITGPNDYGLQEVPVPKPRRGEVLVRIKACAICGSDPKIFDGGYKGMWPPGYPFIAGHEWAGEIVQLGEEVTGFEVGDRVAGEAHKGCGHCRACKAGFYNLCVNYGKNETGHRHYGFTYQGAYAEYNAYSVNAIAKLPDNLSYNEGALVDTAGTAYHGIELAGVTPGGTSVIIGPGPVGIFTMMIAKSMGSRTVMVGRGRRLQVAAKMGADAVVDYEKEDPVRRVMEITGGSGADEVFECAGSEAAVGQAVQVARKGGRIALLGIYGSNSIPVPLRTVVLNQISILGSRANPNVSEKVISLMSAGKIDAGSMVTHEFPLEKIREAIDTFVRRVDGALKVVVKP